jgi:hypothetical protein
MMLSLRQRHLHQIYRKAAERQRIPARPTRRQLDVLRCVALQPKPPHLALAPDRGAHALPGSACEPCRGVGGH